MATLFSQQLREIADALDVRPVEPRHRWSREEVANYIGVSVRTLDRMRCDPDFPKPFYLGSADLLRWCPDEVETWFYGQPRATF